MAFTLGSAPDTLKVVLVKGADFVSTLTRKDGTDWPVDTEVVLEFKTTSPVSWSATLTGSSAMWNVDQADVDALIAAKPRSVKLWYVEGEVRLLWAQGDLDIRS